MSRLVYPPKNINNTPANPFEIQNLTVLGNASIAGSLSAGATSVSTLSAGGTAQLNNAHIAGTLAVVGNTTLSTLSTTGNVHVQGHTQLDRTLTVNQTSTFYDVVTINSSFVATGTGTASTLYETQAATTVTQADYLVLDTDRIIKLETTGAGGPFIITFPNISTRNRVTIIMTAMNTAVFTTNVLLSGSSFGWAAVGDVATFVNLGSGVWYLDGTGISNAP